MKRFTRIFCVFLAVIMLMSFPVNAEDVSPRSSSFFVGYSAFLSEVDAYNFKVYFRVTAKRTMDELGAYTVKVQISDDGEDWATTQTYTKEDYPSFICEDTFLHAYSFNYNGSKGYYYRAIITLYAKDSTGTAKYTVYTAPIQLGV